ncbi:MAG: hypothetical protein NC223_10630 [Butyrivibrio sp.]|nr:hypothetical protein [Butyrivibrio sp.]
MFLLNHKGEAMELSLSEQETTEFSLCFMEYLFNKYNLEEFEQFLLQNNVKPILPPSSPCSKISRYFRFMNAIDESCLSISERELMSVCDKDKMSQENFRCQYNEIFEKLIHQILSLPKGYCMYSYDGGAKILPPEYKIRSLNEGEQSAPRNHITFGIYYTKFDESTEYDVFRNNNLALEARWRMAQQENVAALLFSEVDVVRKFSRQL